jgi:hypothetical protein
LPFVNKKVVNVTNNSRQQFATGQNGPEQDLLISKNFVV